MAAPNPKRVELWSWALIYGGLLALSLGWFVMPYRGPWGELLFSAGGVAAAVGVALIFVRARMEDTAP
jgi:hypothetical protein